MVEHSAFTPTVHAPLSHSRIHYESMLLKYRNNRQKQVPAVKVVVS